MSKPKEQVLIFDENGEAVDPDTVEKLDNWDLCRSFPGFPKGLINFLSAEKGCGFPAPSSIQAYSWPALVTGKDFIGVAKTGSGKTLAFLLPAFMWLRKSKKSDTPVDTDIGPAILVLTPSRELCFQIFADAEKFGSPVKITAACAYGGAPKWEQEQRFKMKPETLIATPGRLADFARTGSLSLDSVRFVTLDEADRMLDMGFEPQVKEVLDWVPKERQVSMFTATWPDGIRKLANNFIHNPCMVQVGSSAACASDTITQHIRILDEKDKTPALKKIIQKYEGKHVLIFCNTKKKCADLVWEFPGSVSLHGNLKQIERDENLVSFKEGRSNILIATDVAARGLDVRLIKCVVNYDVPFKADEDYVHRIGRTGRGGDLGDAYSFLTWGEERMAKAILAIMENGQLTAPQCLVEMAGGRTKAGFGTAGFGAAVNGDGHDDLAPDKAKPAKAGGGGGWGGSSDDEDKPAAAPKKTAAVSKGGGADPNEKRVHPSDKSETGYTYAEYKAFAPDMVDKMWAEGKPVAVKRAAPEAKAPAAKKPKAEKKKGEWGGSSDDEEVVVAETKDVAEKKDVKMGTSGVGASETIDPNEKRAHPSDSTNTGYTYAEYKSFAPDMADKMWKEAKAPDAKKEEAAALAATPEEEAAALAGALAALAEEPKTAEKEEETKTEEKKEEAPAEAEE